MNTLVSIDDLVAHLEDPEWLVFDTRFSLADAEAGEQAYRDSHIAGAHYVHLESDLSSPHIPGSTGRHPLPDKAQWIKTVQALGISPEKQVVVYDDAGGAMASRMWWMLGWIGHVNVAVLDGGWQAWTESGHPVSSGDEKAPLPSTGDYGEQAPLVRIVKAGGLNGSQQLLLDARDLPRYLGEVEPIDPVAGHIPGAKCSPFTANLGENGHFLSATDLKQKFRDAVMTDREVVCYCGSGVTACHNILAMKIAGLAEPALYPGSWSEWITDPERDIAAGPDT